MGEMADYLINGDDCEVCGMPFEEPGDGYPRKCEACQQEEDEKLKEKKKMRKTGVISAALIVSVLCISAMASDVAWSRLRGKVKKIDGKKLELTIQNKEGDDLTVKVDGDVLIVRGKDEVKLPAVQMDDQVTLLWMPKVPVPKDPDEPPAGSTYLQERR